MAKENKNKVPIYDASSVRRNFWQWYYFLENIALRVFEYKNLPANLPAIEIERNLINRGFAGVYKHPTAGLVTTTGALSGIGIYNYPTAFTSVNPVLGSTQPLKIGLECEVIYSDSNSYRRISTAQEIIAKYARLLAEVTSTIAITARNSRTPIWAVATDEKAKQSLMSYFDKVSEGEYDVITSNNTMFETIKGITADVPTANSLKDFNDSLDDIIKGFYRDYGIRYIQQKRERMINAEITMSDDEVLYTNILDMFESRKLGVERVNNLYGTNIEVHIANGLDRRGLDVCI